MHGLPAEYRTADDRLEDWPTVLGYLDALETSGLPIVVAVRDDRAPFAYLQHVGYLRRVHRAPGDSPNSAVAEIFSIRWPDQERRAGSVALYERLFEGATLSTVDGDDYFSLTLSFGSFKVMFEDANKY